MKEFGDILAVSWIEYKKNFKTVLIIFLLLSLVPSLIFLYLSLPVDYQIFKLGVDAPMDQKVQILLNYKFIIPLAIMPIIVLLIYFLITPTIINLSFKSSKNLTFEEALKQGGGFYVNYFLYSLVYAVFLIGLFLLLIVPGIIFAVFWVFSPYILIKERKGIIESLKKSFDLVKGRWWKTFGILLLFILFMILVSIAIGIIPLIIRNGYIFFISSPISYAYYVLFASLDALFSWVGRLITIPLGVFIFKNYYLEYLYEKKEK